MRAAKHTKMETQSVDRSLDGTYTDTPSGLKVDSSQILKLQVSSVSNQNWVNQQQKKIQTTLYVWWTWSWILSDFDLYFLHSSLSLSVLQEQFTFKNLFSALFTAYYAPVCCCVHCCRPPKTKPHFCCSILKKLKPFKMMTDYKLSAVSVIKPL